MEPSQAKWFLSSRELADRRLHTLGVLGTHIAIEAMLVMNDHVRLQIAKAIARQRMGKSIVSEIDKLLRPWAAVRS